MTVEEQRKRIKEHCLESSCLTCLLHGKDHCFGVGTSDLEIADNYEILFGKESEEWLEVDPGNPWESEEQNVPAEPKITLRELLDIMEVSLIISEKYFDNVLVILKTDEYTPETYTSILAPEFLDREVSRMKTQDNNILVALKEVE